MLFRSSDRTLQKCVTHARANKERKKGTMTWQVFERQSGRVVKCRTKLPPFPVHPSIHQPAFLLQAGGRVTAWALSAFFFSSLVISGFPHIDKVQGQIELARQHPRPPSSSSPRHTHPATQSHQPWQHFHLRVCPRAIGQSTRPSPSPSFPFPSLASRGTRSLSFWAHSN